jgi:hypothetical protein
MIKKTSNSTIKTKTRLQECLLLLLPSVVDHDGVRRRPQRRGLGRLLRLLRGLQRARRRGVAGDLGGGHGGRRVGRDGPGGGGRVFTFYNVARDRSLVLTS